MRRQSWSCSCVHPFHLLYSTLAQICLLTSRLLIMISYNSFLAGFSNCKNYENIQTGKKICGTSGKIYSLQFKSRVWVMYRQWPTQWGPAGRTWACCSCWWAWVCWCSVAWPTTSRMAKRTPAMSPFLMVCGGRCRHLHLWVTETTGQVHHTNRRTPVTDNHSHLSIA